ncbi:MAG TPA: hypothetical protein VKE74_01725, partial [Gemmataceae bacterium]|nr:hypothetical protein [Gemmataceae bacterium]
MTRTRLLVTLIGTAVLAPAVSAQVKYPPRPEKVDVQIRYRIRADRDERARQFRVLEAHLKSLKFVPFPREDADLDILDPTAERFTGTMPSATVLDTLIDPRVQTILFAPAGYQYPDAVDKPVSVRIGITTGFLPADQQRFHGQVVGRLTLLGFREAIGYDTRGHTWIRGQIPYGNLGRLLKDLRREPSGWFLSDSPPELLPPPIRDVLPIRWVEVLAEADLTFLTPQPLAPNRALFTPDLRAALDDPATKTRPLRVEVVLDAPADDVQLTRLRTRLRVASTSLVTNPRTKQPEVVTATVEGATGHVVTVNFPAGTEVERLIEEPGIALVRLPRPGIETVAPLAVGRVPDPPAAVLAASHFDRVHQAGYRGKGSRIVVIASDFPNVGGLIGKDLPADTRVIDLTAELTPTLDPLPPVPGRVSGGIAAARAAHIAAPEAELILVRVDPTAFFQLLSVARYATGEIGYTEALQTRVTELASKANELRGRYLEAVEAYRRAFTDPADDDAARARRVQAKENIELIAKERELLSVWVDRSIALHNALKSLNGVTVVVNTLVWETGYRLDGLSELSQTIDLTFAGDADLTPRIRSATRPRVMSRPVWVQPASPSAGSVWGGPYLDGDRNSVMEFAPPQYPIPVDSWTRELNFLAARNPNGIVNSTLPAGTRVRLTVQWREPQDPTVYGGRDATSPLFLRVFKQLDPTGQKRASDELEEVARSVGGPYRVAKEPTYGAYEQIVEFDVAEAGVFCVRVEGLSGFDPVLPALKPQFEINP